MGGGEKLVYELAKFALENNIKPTVLITDYPEEYYDGILRKMNVPVIRTRLDNITTLRDPKKIVKAIFWRLRLKYFPSKFDSVHVISLYTADIVKNLINHKKKYFWHVVNSIQYRDSKLPFSPELLKGKDYTIIFTNEYQPQEIEEQYGEIGGKTLNFKLFIN
jgi:hypothetical protein